MNDIASCLIHQYGCVRVDTNSCQCCLATVRSLRGATVTRLARTRVGNRAYIPFFLCFHLPRFYRAFLSFQQSRTLFSSTFFLLPSFLHTGCWSHHPLEQRSPYFISAAFSSFSSISIFDIKQTWETSFGTSTLVLSLSLRVFVSPSSLLLPGSSVNLANRVAAPITYVSSNICRYLLGRLLGPDLAQVFLGLHWGNIARPRRVSVSSSSMHTLTLNVFPPDRINL